MSRRRRNGDALDILRRRYSADDPTRQASIREERVHAQVARLIYDLRVSSGMTQKELADLVNTSQSAISRLEDADYEGHSLSMLERITRALNQRLHVTASPSRSRCETRASFQGLLRGLRLRMELTIDELSREAAVDASEIWALEHESNHIPSPHALFKLSQFFGVPQRSLALLAGVIADQPEELRDRASRFAAQSDSFARLTQDERRILDEFLKFLKENT